MAVLDDERRVAPGFDAGIIGAGFGGILAALEMRKAGRNFVIFERAQEPGGVWRDNVYPGCACDIRSHLYSLAAEPYPDWKNEFAQQPEILAYLNDIVTRHGLRANIRFGVEIASARFVEAIGVWQVADTTGREYTVRTLILAGGSHNRPWQPTLPGAETFLGRIFHSSAWDRSTVLEGKRVAVIGTGASAIQIVPSVASAAAEVTVFQRTPAWILPRGDRTTTKFERRLFRRLPWTQRLLRSLIYWLLELSGLAFHGNEFIHRIMTRVALGHLAHQVPDEGTRAQLTPDYKLGCKRIVLSDDFYPAFNRANVRLVTVPIQSISPLGLTTEDGVEHAADVIVMATGFIVTGMDGYLDIIGLGGRRLKDEWTDNGMRAFLGIHVSGYPNLALLMGPNSGLGHSSVIHVMESQMRYITSWLESLDCAGEVGYFDVKPETQRAYNEALQTRLKHTVWASGCRSWYLDRQGNNSTVYPGLTRAYRRATAVFRREDYDFVCVPTSQA